VSPGPSDRRPRFAATPPPSGRRLRDDRGSLQRLDSTRRNDSTGMTGYPDTGDFCRQLDQTRDNVSNTETALNSIRRRSCSSPSSAGFSSRVLTGIGAMMRIAASPRRTQDPIDSHALNPATNVASGHDSATSSWLLSDRRASPPRERTRTQRAHPSELSSCSAACCSRSRSVVRRCSCSCSVNRRDLDIPDIPSLGPAGCGPVSPDQHAARRATLRGAPARNRRARTPGASQRNRSARPSDKALGVACWVFVQTRQGVPG
jgi:hypothetical protein